MRCLTEPSHFAQQMSNHKDTKSEDGGHDGRGDTGEKNRQTDHNRQLQEDEVNGGERSKISGAQVPRLVVEGNIKPNGHNDGIDEKRKNQAQVFTDNKFKATYRLGEDMENGPPFNFLRYQTDADEDGHNQPEDRDRAQAEIDDDDFLNAHRNAAAKNSATDHQQGKDDEVIKNLVPHCLLERMKSNCDNTVHRFSRPPVDWVRLS